MYQHKNFAISSIGSLLNSGDTSVTLATGTGSKFPASGQFKVAIWGKGYGSPADDPNREICTLSIPSGDTFSISRGEEGTSAGTWPTGSKISLTLTAGELDGLQGLPTGGATGEVLTKASGADGDVVWDGLQGLPTGGATGEVLTKASGADGDVVWDGLQGLPTGGATGEVLTKASGADGDVVWDGLQGLPTGGATGEVLAKASGADGDVAWVVPSGGGSPTPHDNTGASSDYALAVGETAFINFTSATSIPLHIATVEGEYELVTIGDTSVSPSSNTSATLSPNNTVTATNAVKRIYLYFGASSASGIVSQSVLTVDAGGTNIRSTSRISTYTKSKCLDSTAESIQTGLNYYASNYKNYWANTTTAWTSLGTITFPFAQSGTIIIRRIL